MHEGRRPRVAEGDDEEAAFGCVERVAPTMWQTGEEAIVRAGDEDNVIVVRRQHD